jgi:hypothetical protein
MKYLRYIPLSLFVTALLGGCSPVSISRIGPAQPNRGKGCDVDVIPPGEAPPHPYRDIGVVHLTNCQEYTTGPCRRWLVDGVCTLGGNVAYLLDPKPSENEFDAVNYRITAGIYIDQKKSTGDEPGCKEPPADPDETEMERCMD